MTYFLTESSAHLRRLLIQRGASIGSIQTFARPDGERGYRLGEDVKRQKVTVLGSVTSDPGTFFDLLGTFRLLREGMARTPSLCIPYLGYARQDKAHSGEAATGLMVAELLRNLNPEHIFVLEPHSDSVLESLGPSAQGLSAATLFASQLVKNEDVDVVVSPDAGGLVRAQQLASLISPETQTAWIEKTRPKPHTALAKALHGEVQGKRVVIFDDIIDTGATVIEAARLLSKQGATSIRIAATHGIFSKDALDRLSRLPVSDILVTNSLAQPRQSPVRVLDITPLLLIE